MSPSSKFATFVRWKTIGSAPMTQGERARDNPYTSPAHTDASPTRRRFFRKLVLASGLAVGLAANAGAIGIMLTLFSFEEGAAIRPMVHTWVAFLFAALGICVAAPLCGLSVFFAPGWRGKTIAGIGILLSVTPLPLASITLHAIAAIMGFTLKA
jgi:hypothetical protein